jgi:FkbM family methyltransferase
VFFFGAYERDELALIAACLSGARERTFVDVGANVGNHVLFAAANGARVVAVEPYGAVRRQLEAKLQENSLTDVFVCPVGFGSHSHFETYVQPSGSNQGSGSFLRSSQLAGDMQLEVQRGDDVLAELKIDKVSMIKVDTEGYEVDVLKGLSQTLAANRPIVMFEWSQDPELSRKEACLSLFPKEYLFFDLRGGRNWGLFFRRTGFSLQPLDGDWPNGNLVGIPVELMDSDGLRSAIRRHHGCIASL